jgi:hypothetical protein
MAQSRLNPSMRASACASGDVPRAVHWNSIVVMYRAGMSV